MTKAMARRLPAGVFYFLGGPVDALSNVWEVTSRGTEQQLTHNPRGFEIDSLAASRAGRILSDAQFNIDELARWTTRGPRWLHPPHKPSTPIFGQAADIRPDGEIAYLLPPAVPGEAGSRNFTIRTMRSYTAPGRISYQQRNFPGVPLFGPDGQLAVIGPAGSYVPKGQKAEVRIISRNRKIHVLNTGFRRLGFPSVWGQNAPALAIPSLSGPEKVFFKDGKVETLPQSWRALAWNQAGTRLLMIRNHELATWSPSRPLSVTTICTLSTSFEVSQISWLARKAPL